MNPLFSTVRGAHARAGRPQVGRLRPRRASLGVVLIAALSLSGIANRGGPQQITAAEIATPNTGHAQVIAQAVIDLAVGNVVWTATTIEVGMRLATIETGGAPGFVLGADDPIVVRDAAGNQTRLDAGEALAVQSADDPSVRAADGGPASLALLTLGRAAVDDGVAFASPGGSRDVELVADVLTEGEIARIDDGAAPIFVLVTAGTIAVDVDDDEILALHAGDSALLSTPVVVTGAAEEPTRFVAAVIGAEVGAGPAASTAGSGDGESETPGPNTPPRPTPPGPGVPPTPGASPRPSPSPASSPSPTPSPSPAADGNGPNDDPDGDGLVNKDEETAGTDRRHPDTDDDRLKDGAEVHTHATNPATYDTDGDGASDGYEVLDSLTDPTKRDTDGDGLSDTEEAFLGINPLAADSDSDGLLDGQEVLTVRSDPLAYDTDGDGASDGYEVLSSGTNPSQSDTDGDGLSDTEEAFLLTSPLIYDMDGDGIGDGHEVLTYRTDPLNSDTDGDGWWDGMEVARQTSPLDPNDHPTIDF